MPGGGFGAFGKIPSLGDFFRLDLAPAFVEPWDAWLQAAMLAGRAAFGDGWTERYMTAPIWRFAIAAGQAGPQPQVGVVMPSVDRVGRHFPLTLAASAAANAPLATLALQEPVLARLELVALDALDDAMTRERLAARLADLTLVPAVAPSRVQGYAGGLALAGEGAATLLPDLAVHLGVRAGAVFATVVQGQARMLVLPGLPQGRAAAALFDFQLPASAEVTA